MYQAGPPPNDKCTKITLYVVCILEIIGGIVILVRGTGGTEYASSQGIADTFVVDAVSGTLVIILGVVGLLGVHYGNKCLLITFIVMLSLDLVLYLVRGILYLTVAREHKEALTMAIACFICMPIVGLIIYCAYVQIKAAEYYRANFQAGNFQGSNVQGGKFQGAIVN